MAQVQSVEVVATADGWPSNIDDYRLDEVIGAGTTAIVHKAYCESRREVCAMKRIRIEKGNRRVDDLDEMQILISSNHKNVVKYCASFVIKDDLWLVLSLLHGGSMLDIINYKQKINGCRNGVLDETTIAIILRNVLKALKSLHYNGLVHSDIKAENILLSKDGNVQIGAFGLSAWFDIGGNESKDKETRSIIENAKWYDPKSDIWSLGIAAIELATGKSPYYQYHEKKVPMTALQNNPLNVTVDYFSDIRYKDYENLKKVVGTCLNRDPTKRPTAEELLKDPFFKRVKNSEFLKQTLSPFMPSMDQRVRMIKDIKRFPDVTGWRYRKETRDWVWSFDDKADQRESQHHSQREDSNFRVPTVENLIDF